MQDFRLDSRLEGDSEFCLNLGLCQLRLMDDHRWPWLMLVPRRNDLCEIFDLTPLDQTLLWLETVKVATALKQVTGAEKINIGALGNIVRQLHVHVIARQEGDPNWPGPVWGHGHKTPWPQAEKHIFLNKLLEALHA